MIIYEVFSHPNRFLHRARLLSGASCVILVCTALTYLSPFLLTYYTGDLWKRESVYSEQPRINDTLKYLFILNNNAPSENRFFVSSFSTLNQKFIDGFLSATVSETGTDVDGDGLNDQFRLVFDLTGAAAIQVNSIDVWIIFPFELDGRQRIVMNTLGLVNYVPVESFRIDQDRQITIYGQLKFEQRQPIGHAGSAPSPLLGLDLSNFDTSTNLDTILQSYYQRDYLTNFQTQYVHETPRDSLTGTGFTLTVVVNVGRQVIRFVPGFWEEFKWGWIQYVCTLIPFVALFNRLKLFVFSNQLVQTVTPLVPHRHQA